MRKKNITWPHSPSKFQLSSLEFDRCSLQIKKYTNPLESSFKMASLNNKLYQYKNAWKHWFRLELWFSILAWGNIKTKQQILAQLRNKKIKIYQNACYCSQCVWMFKFGCSSKETSSHFSCKFQHFDRKKVNYVNQYLKRNATQVTSLDKWGFNVQF